MDIVVLCKMEEDRPLIRNDHRVRPRTFFNISKERTSLYSYFNENYYFRRYLEVGQGAVGSNVRQ